MSGRRKLVSEWVSGWVRERVQRMVDDKQGVSERVSGWLDGWVSE